VVSHESDTYDGPERRIEQRRKIPDRRAMVRYEPEKHPRRSGRDRRNVHKDIWEFRDF
jgi:hypothetical protein